MENPGDDVFGRHGQQQLMCFSDALAKIRSLEVQLIVAHAHRDRTTELIQHAVDVLEDLEPLNDVIRRLRTRLAAELIEATAQPPGSGLLAESASGSGLSVDSTHRVTSGVSMTYERPSGVTIGVTTTFRWTRHTQTDAIADAHAV